MNIHWRNFLIKCFLLSFVLKPSTLAEEMAAQPFFGTSFRVDCGGKEDVVSLDTLQSPSFIHCIEKLIAAGRLPLANQWLDKVLKQQFSVEDLQRLTLYKGMAELRSGNPTQGHFLLEKMLNLSPTQQRLKEEAAWVLALSKAVSSTLPDTLKTQLIQIDSLYWSGAGYKEAGFRVIQVLKNISEEELRIQLKRMASRIYEKQGGGEETPGPSNTLQLQPEDLQRAARSRKMSDSLKSLGQYLQAWNAVLWMGPAADSMDIQRRKKELGTLYCEESRKKAAQSFKDAGRVRTQASKLAHLQRAKEVLDSCITVFPDIELSERVRRNAELVRTEMERVK